MPKVRLIPYGIEGFDIDGELSDDDEVSPFDDVADVDDATLARWKRALEELSTVQDEMIASMARLKRERAALNEPVDRYLSAQMEAAGFALTYEDEFAERLDWRRTLDSGIVLILEGETYWHMRAVPLVGRDFYVSATFDTLEEALDLAESVAQTENLELIREHVTRRQERARKAMMESLRERIDAGDNDPEHIVRALRVSGFSQMFGDNDGPWIKRATCHEVGNTDYFALREVDGEWTLTVETEAGLPLVSVASGNLADVLDAAFRSEARIRAGHDRSTQRKRRR